MTLQRSDPLTPRFSDRRTTRRCDRRTLLRVGATALATLGLAGCTSDGSAGARTVEMSPDLAFAPETAPVEVGGTVTWTNESEVEHTVTAYADRIPDNATYFASGGFDSERAARANLSEGLVAPGEEYSHSFDRAGTYDYYCIPHEGSGMVGTVRVE